MLRASKQPLKFLKAAGLVENIKYPLPLFTRSSTSLTSKWRLVEDPVVSMIEIKKHPPHLSLKV